MVIAVSSASDLERMLPWLMALATVAVAIGIGSLLLSVDAAHEHQTASARMPKPLSLPRQRRGGMTPRALGSDPKAVAQPACLPMTHTWGACAARRSHPGSSAR